MAQGAIWQVYLGVMTLVVVVRDLETDTRFIRPVLAGKFSPQSAQCSGQTARAGPPVALVRRLI